MFRNLRSGVLGVRKVIPLELGGLAFNRMATAASTLLLIAIQAELLGSAKFGQFGLALIIVMLGPLLGGSVRVANSRFIAAGELSINGGHRYTLRAAAMATTGCLFLTSVAYLLVPKLQALGPAILWTAAIAGGVFAYRDGLAGSLNGAFKILTSAILDTTAVVIQIVALGFIFLSGLWEIGVLSVLWTFIAANFATSTISHRQLRTAKVDGTQLTTKTAGYRAVISTSNLVQMVSYRIDSFVLANYVDETDLGTYLLIVRLTGFVVFVPNVLNMFLWPRLAKAGATKGAWSSARKAWLVTTPITVLAGFILAFVTASIAESRFPGALTIGLILIPAVALVESSKLLSAYISSTTTPRQLLYVALVVAVISLSLYVALIPRYGTVGAGISSMIAYLVSTTLVAAVFYRARPA